MSISIIVRSKDRPILLAEALGSLAEQTSVDLEVVVVNDGGASVESVTSRFETLQIKLIELRESIGRVAAANAGIEAASGQLIGFLDDDDLLQPGALEALAAVADEDTVVYGTVEAWQMEDEGGREPYCFRRFGRPFDEVALAFENFLPIIGSLIPRKHLRAIGGLDAELECYEDWDLYLRLSERCEMRWVDRSVARYRVFGAAFITGAGGQEWQHEGRVKLLSKHRDRFDPETLSRMQHFVKSELLPKEIGDEGDRWRQRLADAERGLADQRDGSSFLSSQVSGLETRLEGSNLRIEELEELVRKTEDERVLLAEEVEALCGPVSVVLVNFNGRHHLERCLPSLQQTEQVEIEVLVVDNASSDDTIEWLAANYPGLRVIALDGNVGFGTANRVGIEAAAHPWIALLNTDTVVEPGWLRALQRAMITEPLAAAACSTLRLLERPELLNGFGGGMTKIGFGFDHRFAEPFPASVDDGPRQVLFPTAAAMLMRRSEFFALGGFDPRIFMYHEDVELGWRLNLFGRSVLAVPDSVVHHLFGGTTASQQSSDFRDRMGQRHNLRALLSCAEPWTLIKALKGLAKNWWQGRVFRIAAHAIAWNLYRLPDTLARRRFIQQRRQRSDAELVQAGLVLDGPQPPRQPQQPQRLGRPEAGNLLVSHVLLPGVSSASGRLGPGWHRPEEIVGRLARMTCGWARAWLQLDPGALGRLELDVHLPEQIATDRSIAVRCAGQELEMQIDGGESWFTLTLDVEVGADGLLEIDIQTPAWVPHEQFGNWDFRRLGCAVAQLRFLAAGELDTIVDPRVSVVITTFNRRDILELALGALAAQDWKDLQVIVVDDGSVDDTWSWLEKRSAVGDLDMVIDRQENQGQGIARNRAISHADGDLVLFLGDDIIAEPQLVSAHVERHQLVEGPCAVVGYTGWDEAGMKVTPALKVVNEEGWQFGYAHMGDGQDVPYTCFYTSNVSVPREILGKQPFDPAFRVYGWEDVEVGWRFALAGLRLVYDRSAKARHRHPMSLADFFRRQIKVGQSLATLLEIHPELATEEFMPPPGRARWYRWGGRRILPMTASLASWLDGLGLPLPMAYLHRLLACGFYIGRDLSEN